MPSLVMDTSSERGIVAFLEGDSILFQSQLPVGYQSAQFLTAELARGLGQLKIATSSIEHIVLGCGPGSYTGIRVAAAVSKTLSYACKIPLIGVCSLEGFIPSNEGSFAVLMDARLSGAYLLKGFRQDDKIEYTCSAHLCSWKDLPEQLLDVTQIISPCIQRLKSELQKLSPQSSHWQWQEIPPCAQRLGQQAQSPLKDQKYSTTGDVELNYLRKTQAEIERKHL